jgi:hypothetical protein
VHFLGHMTVVLRGCTRKSTVTKYQGLSRANKCTIGGEPCYLSYSMTNLAKSIAPSSLASTHLLVRILPCSVIRLEGGIDGIKGGGGGESICRPAKYLVGL